MNYSGLIVGLGNPGGKYAYTRHNIGFMVVQTFLEYNNPSSIHIVDSEYKKNIYKSWKVNLRDENQDWLVCTPLTYMNLSGKAVHKLAKKYNFASDQIIVVHDELDLPYGKMKFKHGGGLSGHNGLISIAGQLKSKDFYRLRVGIGRPSEGKDVVEHVLSRFNRQEYEQLSDVVKKAAYGLYLFSSQGLQTAMNQIH